MTEANVGARRQFAKKVGRAAANFSDRSLSELVALLEAVLKKLSVKLILVEAVEISRVHKTISVYTSQEEIEIGLDPKFGMPRRREREFIQPRGYQMVQPVGWRPNGGTRVHPRNIH